MLQTHSHICYLLKVVLALLALASIASAQIPNVTDSTSTPVPGVGHDYIRTLAETVNPANGSVSVRIQAPIPKGRGLTIPFSFAYDSNGATHPESGLVPGTIYWNGNTGEVATGGWSYSVPLLSEVQGIKTLQVGAQYYQCPYVYDFVFQDASGGRHPLYISLVYDPTTTGCQMAGGGLSSQSSGGDGVYQAHLTSSYGASVVDPDGTVYSFPIPGPNAAANAYSYIATMIQDRNGNVITVNDSSNGVFSYTDTVGRTAISSSGFGSSGNTVTVSGLPNPSYIISWSTINPTGFSPGGTLMLNDGQCPTTMSNGGASGPMITDLELPNSQHYLFGYDTTTTGTGLLNSIRYPTGEWVEYDWEVNGQSEFGVFADRNGAAQQCEFTYGMPAVAHRYVSYDGRDPRSYPALKQDFTYSTQWNSGSPLPWTWGEKQTTVETTDLISNSSFQTVYTYTPMATGTQPLDTNTFGSQIPVESMVNEASGLRITDKMWNDMYSLTCQDVTLQNGSTVRTSFTYGVGDQLTGKYEYDFGSQCSPASGSLLRQTLTTYYSFQATTIYPSGPSIFDRPATVTVEDGSGNPVAETTYSYDGVGNATSKTQKCLLNCAADLVTGYAYNSDGQLKSMTDPRLNTTSYTYGTQDAYLTQITYPTTTSNGVAHSVGFQFDFSKGLMTQSTDQNQKPTSYGYDVLERLNSVGYPDNGQTNYTYTDGSPTSTVETQKSISSGNTYTSTETVDGGGRVTQTNVSSPEGGICVNTSYDGLGQKVSVSNPFTCSGSPSAYTTYTYDSLGRNADVSPNYAIQYPDGTHESITYSGNSSTVIDGGSMKRTLVTDALGRLDSVTEDPGGLNYQTAYSYDLLDNLSSVSQNGQSRSFSYDSFSRLVSATNPETGEIQYSYDGNGNVVSKMDARGTTSYAYDEFDRVLYKNYTDPSTTRACYAYDGFDGWGDTMTNAVGHMTTSWGVQHDGGLTSDIESYQFDPMGRLLAQRQCTPATCGITNYPVSATYNLMGNETSLTESSVTRSTGYDSADRLLAFTGNPPGMGNQNLLTNPQYNAVGMVQAALGNGLTETRGYNNRTWLQSLSVGSAYSLGLTYAGNGNVLTANDSENGNWTYGYDGANRLRTASGAGQAFTYNPDTWGNMTCTNTGNLPCTPQGLSFNTATNRITTSGYNYDAAGNLLSDSTHSYIYDAENRITCVLDAYGQCSQNAVQYLYDADGHRVGKQQGNTLEDYVYDPQGHVISVHDGSANLLRSEIYTPEGRQMATWNSNGLFYNHADWLGTERVRTNSGGTAVEWCSDTPYGMNLACTTPDLSPMHFTAKQRDSESGLDDFGARYFGGGNNLGRFMTPDPSGKDAAHFDDPQSWNLYTYVRDNPTTLVDVDGRDWATAWQDAKAAVGTMYFRLTVGIGIGGKSEQGPLQVKLEAAAKVNIKFSSADRKLSVTKNDTDIGATIGPNGTKSQVGLGASVENTVVSLQGGQFTGPEPPHGQLTSFAGTENYGTDPSSNEVGIGAEGGRNRYIRGRDWTYERGVVVGGKCYPKRNRHVYGASSSGAAIAPTSAHGTMHWYNWLAGQL